MLDSHNFVKIFSGSFIEAQLIRSRLENINIVPVTKDESESARLAGFGSALTNFQELFVHEKQYRAAMVIVNAAMAEIRKD